jgi:hypothetical protein
MSKSGQIVWCQARTDRGGQWSYRDEKTGCIGDNIFREYGMYQGFVKKPCTSHQHVPTDPVRQVFHEPTSHVAEESWK